MHVYWTTAYQIPKTTVKEINTMLKWFLWCHGEFTKGKARGLKMMFMCTDQGDLGIKSLHIWNKVLLTKHIWNIATKKDTLWVKWVTIVKSKQRSI